MDYNKIRINFTGYNRTLSQYEEAKAEAEKTYTPKRFTSGTKKRYKCLEKRPQALRKV